MGACCNGRRSSIELNTVAVMHILFVVPYAPTAIRVRPYSLVRFLAQRGHTVTLATLWESTAEQQALVQLEAQGIRVITAPLSKPQKIHNVIRGWWRGLPIQAGFCESTVLLDQIQQFLASTSVDLVHVEHLRGAYYGLALAHNQPAPVIWDSVDCISYLFEQAATRSRSLTGRIMTQIDLRRTRHYEGWLARQFGRVLVTSINDLVALQKLAGDIADIRVLSNGVDLEYFAPTGMPYIPDTVVYSGKMSYHANVSAALYLAEEIMPLVWKHKPDVRLNIVGSKPPARIRRLAKDSRISVTGYVQDMRQPLRTAAVAVAPLLYGAGIQNKVLEAMACGTPVVATSLAVSALELQTGRDCLVADTPTTLAAAILEVLNSGALRARLSQSGRQFVETHHNWHHIIAQLEQHYQAVIALSKNAVTGGATNSATGIGGEYSYVHQSNSKSNSTDSLARTDAPVATHAQPG